MIGSSVNELDEFVSNMQREQEVALVESSMMVPKDVKLAARLTGAYFC